MNTNTTTRRPRLMRASALGGAGVALALVLSGCAGGTAATPAPSVSAAAAADSVKVVDGWAKASESGMTAAFGEIENTGNEEITLLSVATTASPDVELHETVADASGQMKMQEKKGGFPIAAGGALSLVPGGNHIMLMDLAAPLKAGDELTFTLSFSDGSKKDVSMPIKDYSGANEKYSDGDSGTPAPGSSGTGHAGHGQSAHGGAGGALR